MKKVLVCFVAFVLVLFVFDDVVFANDFEENSAYYESVCFNVTLASKDENKQKCLNYKDYLRQKANDAKNNTTNYERDLAKIRAEIEVYLKDIAVIEAEIAELNEMIAANELNINKAEENIKILDEEIAVIQAEVDEIDTAILNMMVATQHEPYFDIYFDFLMASNDLEDLMSKLSIVNDITSYNTRQIEIRNEKIDEIDGKKVIQVAQRDLAKEAKTLNETYKTNREGKQEYLKSVLSEFRVIEAQKMEELNSYRADYANLQNKFENINFDSINPSSGFLRPTVSGTISATTWFYPGSFGGGTHLGTDYTGAVGTEVRAAANGYVILSENACPTWGGLGNWCGYPGVGGGGNQVQIIVRVDNRTYAVSYFHLQKDSPIALGTQVNQGQLIGRIGSSGNSSGPHTHVEVIYLGTMSAEQYILSWRGDVSHGTRWGDSGLSYRCDYNGNSAPCRLQPHTVF